MIFVCRELERGLAEFFSLKISHEDVVKHLTMTMVLTKATIEGDGAGCGESYSQLIHVALLTSWVSPKGCLIPRKLAIAKVSDLRGDHQGDVDLQLQVLGLGVGVTLERVDM